MSELETRLVQRVRELSDPMEPLSTGMSPRLEAQPEMGAVLFDVYGTLFLSTSGDVSIARQSSDESALARALDEAGFDGDLEEAGRRGRRLFYDTIEERHRHRREQQVEHPEVDVRCVWREVLDALCADGLLEGSVTKNSVLRTAVEYECRASPVWPAPGLEETLNELSRRGLTLGIISNAQFYTPLLFRAFLGGSPEALGFREELCVWSWKLKEAKPSTRLYNRAASVLQRSHGLSPDQALYVGNDMLNDIWPASEVGFTTALFAADRRSLRRREDDERCRDLQPDVVLTDLSQVLDLLPS
ncbi:MAG: HAD family hydrolase [Planctomycetota bacterium]